MATFRITPSLPSWVPALVLALLLPSSATAQDCSELPPWERPVELQGPAAPDAENEDELSIRGRVRDEGQGVWVPGARVDTRWEDRNGEEVEGEAWTDADGRFRVCGIPEGTRVRILARVGGGPGEESDVVAGSGEEVLLSVPLPSPGEPSGLLGTVLEVGSEQGVSRADIRIPALDLTASTDSRGTFLFEEVPPGSYLIQVSHLSYGTVTDSVHLVAGRPLEARFRVDPDPIRIAGIQAVARSRARFGEEADLRRRMERGFGSFVTRADIERLNEPPLHLVLSTVPGIRIQTINRPWGPTFYPTMRSCGTPEMYVDGARVSVDGGGTALDINTFLTTNIETIEVYRGSATVPPRFANQASCGVIVIWTRRGG